MVGGELFDNHASDVQLSSFQGGALVLAGHRHPDAFGIGVGVPIGGNVEPGVEGGEDDDTGGHYQCNPVGGQAPEIGDKNGKNVFHVVSHFRSFFLVCNQ